MATDYGLHFLLVLWSFLTGVLLSAVYDLFRVFRVGRKTNGIILFFEDILFCIVCSLFFAILFFNLSFGKMRAFAFVFAAAGFLLWRFLVGNLFVSLCVRLRNFIRKQLRSFALYIRKSVFLICQRIYTKIYIQKISGTARSGFPELLRKQRKSENEKETTETH